MVTYSLLGIIILILDIVAILSVLSGGGSAGYKIVWVLVILFLPVIGMILYFLIGKNSVTV